MEKEKFASEIKIFLKKRGIKQNDLAKELGVTHPVVSNIVNGRDRLGRQSAIKWGEITGIDPLWLMTQGEQGNSPNGSPPITTEAEVPIDVINVPILSPDAAGGFRPNDQADTINSVALSTLAKANEAVMQLGSVRGMTTAKVRDMIAEHIYPGEDVDTRVLTVMRSYIAQCAKPNSADKFEQTVTHLTRWLGNKGAKLLQFSNITPDWLHDFDRYLISYCPSLNSRSIHMRNIRTIYNYAINHNLTGAPYPFRQFKIKSAPSTPTALTLEQLRALWHYTPATDAQAYALDIFKLIFALIGINMADLCRLVKVSQGRINYTRQKTGRVYSVKVEDVAKRLIKAHRGKTHLINLIEHYKSVHVATTMINRHLKDIASDLGLPPITTYTARYTWASLALGIDTPIEVISQALGHTYGMAVTLGYIVPDRRKVDEANSKVLGKVLKM